MYKSKETVKLNNELNKIYNEINNNKNIDKNLEILLELEKGIFLKSKIKYLIGQVYIKKKEIINGLKKFKELYEYDNSFNSLMSLINCLMEIGDINQAIKYIEKCDDPEQKYLLYGKIYFKIREYDKAIKAFNKLKYSKLNYEANLFLSDIYFNMENYEKAKEYRRKSMYGNSRNLIKLFFIKIDLLENSRDCTKKIEQYKKEKEIKPRERTHLNRIIEYNNYINNKLKKEECKTYNAKQLYSYSKSLAIKHINQKHKFFQDLSYEFFDYINIEEIYDYCFSHLDNIIVKDISDKYIVELPYEVGGLENQTTNLVEVVTIHNTKNILTIYPVFNKNRKINFDLNSYNKKDL